MRAFTCDVCGQILFFENSICLRCSSPLGYFPDRRALVARASSGAERCANADVIGCNWVASSAPPQMGLCRSCRLTRTRPADDDTVGIAEWAEGERAKRRLLYQLDSLGLAVEPRDDSTGSGLAFDLLSSRDVKVVTGHDNGLITLDLAEADDLHREQVRLELDEPYRTVLGHFRHEIGHYYWPLLVKGADLDRGRTLFGDDRQDYAEAVERHYARPAENWEESHISRYATMHPYEDWAETFAHYLHILDLLETAAEWGVVAPVPDSAAFPEVVARWLGLSYALNQLNRSVGLGDLYPFVLTGRVVEKLTFVAEMVGQGSGPAAGSDHRWTGPM